MPSSLGAHNAANKLSTVGETCFLLKFLRVFDPPQETRSTLSPSILTPCILGLGSGISLGESHVLALSVYHIHIYYLENGTLKDTRLIQSSHTVA